MDPATPPLAGLLLDPPPPYTPLLIPLLSPATSGLIPPTIGNVVQLQTTLQALLAHARNKRQAISQARAQVEAAAERERGAKGQQQRGGAAAARGERERTRERESGGARGRSSATPAKAGAGPTTSTVKVERATTPSLPPSATGAGGSPLTPVPSPAGSRPSTPTAGANDDDGAGDVLSDASSAVVTLASSKLKKKRKRGVGATTIVSDDEPEGEEDDPSAAGREPDRKRERGTPVAAASAATPSSSSSLQAHKPGKAGGVGDDLPRFKKKNQSREPSIAAAVAGPRAQTPPITTGALASQGGPSTPATGAERQTASPAPPAATAPMPKIKLSISSAARAVSPLAVPAGGTPGGSPAPAAMHTTGPPAALVPVAPTPPALLGAHIDFRLPLATRSLVPPRPAVAEPLPSLPLTQAEVVEDFTQVKPPASQLAFATFLSHAEAYTRAVGEEDLAFLKGYKDEDAEPYVVPPLGQHYTHQFAEEDRLAALGQPYVPPAAVVAGAPAGSGAGLPNTSLDYPRLRKADFGFDPLESLAEESLVDESRSLGPVSERVVGGLLDARGERLDRFQHPGLGLATPLPSIQPQPQPEQQPPLSLSGQTTTGSGGGSDRQVDGSLGRLEERMKKELLLLGLLGDEPIDWSQRADDEISTSLRQCQKLLATQTALNTARKSILLSIAKDRLAFAEYQQCLDGLDRVIESAWTKRQKLLGRQQKRKLGSAPLPGTSIRISAKEKERDDKEREQQRLLMETVRRAMDRRRLLVEHVGGLFREEEEDEPGRFFGLPKTTVYEGLTVVDAHASTNAVGQAKSAADARDVHR